MVMAADTGTKYCPNGYQFGRSEPEVQKAIPDNWRFQFHPKRKDQFTGTNALGLCPQIMGGDEIYPRIVAHARKTMDGATDHLYANWEPYMYQKQGCVCDRCKEAFVKFAGEEGKMTRADALALWPDCTIDASCEIHNQFAGHQISVVMDRLNKAAGEERFAMPKDYYFQSVLNFVSGLDGHGSYRDFGVDARYLRWRSKAARVMAAHEAVVMHGKADGDFQAAIASPLS